MSTAGANAADRPLIRPRVPACADDPRLHPRKKRPVRTRHAARATITTFRGYLSDRTSQVRSDEVGLIESGLVSCGESCVPGELDKGALVVARGGAQGAGHSRSRRRTAA